jgi:hypothetical protein
MAAEQVVSEGYKAVELVVASGIGGTVVGVIMNFWVGKKLQAQQHEHDKRIIEYTSLHDKQAEIIADFYAQLSGLYGSIEQLMAEYQLREMKEEIEREHPHIQKSKQIGLTGEEQEAVNIVKVCNMELFEFYRKNKIYLSSIACELTNRFCTLASYLAVNYHNVTSKDEDGKLYVTSEVKKVWDKAIEVIPKLLTQLEKEFRDILGVKS